MQLRRSGEKPIHGSPSLRASVPAARMGTERTIVAYFWDKSSKRYIENSKATVVAACQSRNLNTLLGVTKAQRDFPEHGFFTPKVDTPASRALRTMLSHDAEALTPEGRYDWARFLISLGVRTPERLRIMGAAEAKKAFDTVATRVKEAPEHERKVSEIIQQNMPMWQRNMRLKVAIDLSSDPVKVEKLVTMQWWLRRWTGKVLLIGDRPLLT
jgi:hypothetical protein